MNFDQTDRRSLLRLAGMLGGGAALGGFGAGRALAAAATATPAAWPAVTALVEGYVAKKQVSGMIAAMGWGDDAPSYIARGLEAFDDPDADGSDTLFRAYSMTKPLTGMVAMMLIAERKLGLDQPLSDFAPEFKHMTVAIDPAKGLEARPAKTAITIRHLMTHTSGLGYAVVGRNKVAAELSRLGCNPAVVSRRVIPGINDVTPAPTPSEFLRRTATVPLVAEPGTRWSYSMGLDVLGVILARVAGKSGLDELMAERLFGPLGMTNSYFQVPAAQAAHLSTNYYIIGGNPVPIDPGATSAFLDHATFAFGGSGLVTTPADYDKFLAMVVNGGRHKSLRVIDADVVARAASNLLPPGTDVRGTYIDGNLFGAGAVVGAGKDEGLYGWSGAAGTTGFAQRKLKLRAGLFTQYMPSEALGAQKEFPKAVGADLAAMGFGPRAVPLVQPTQAPSAPAPKPSASAPGVAAKF